MNKKIEIYLNELEDYKNKYNKNRISSELFDYILEEIKTINIKEKIEIDIYTNNFKLNDKEKEELALIIKTTYQDDSNDLIYIDNTLTFKELIMLLIGVIVIIIYFIFHNSPIISEIILIIGWLIIGEALERLFFSKTEARYKIKRRNQIIKSKINFID